MYKIPRTITSYYPDGNNPGNMKMFQDKTSQIRGFKFKRDFLKDITKEEYSSNYAVYFLFNDERNEYGKKLVYVGQSKLGAQRIDSHIRNKDFWTYAIMFVSDNNVFDANAIDYMEYFFINMLLETDSYNLENTEKRAREPNINYVDKSIYHSFLMQIEFLLKAEGVDFDEVRPEKYKDSVPVDISTQDDFEIKNEVNYDSMIASNKCYIPVSSKHKDSKIYVEDGQYFVKEGSIIHKPDKSMLEWSDNGAKYHLLTKKIDKYISKGDLSDRGKYCITNKPIPFKSPSGAAVFICGTSVNGWEFFDGIKELKDINGNNSSDNNK